MTKKIPPPPYVGVHHDPSSEQASWRVRIKIHGERRYLGRYRSAREAARAYDAASVALRRDPPNYSAGLLSAPPSPADVLDAHDRIHRGARLRTAGTREYWR